MNLRRRVAFDHGRDVRQSPGRTTNGAVYFSATLVCAAMLAATTCAAADPTAWLSGAWSATASATKKGWNTTVDVVTLKPIRKSFSKKSSSKSELRLGAHPDSRKSAQKPSPSLLGSLFAPKAAEPKHQPSIEGFFAQDRPR